MTLTAHKHADDYIRSLEMVARVLPRRERDELVLEICDHIDEALPADPTEADVLNVLDQLGSPEDIVAAARRDVPVAGVRRGAREAFAIVLLVTGLPPVIGWLVGLGLLLWSPLWSGRQKLLGALVWPGGMFAVFLATALPAGQGSSQVCRGGDPVLVGRAGFASTQSAIATCSTSSSIEWWAVVALIAILLAPVAVGIYLWRAAGRRSAA